MDWGNAIVRSIARDAAGAVTGLEVELHLEGDVKKTKLKATWLAVDDTVPAPTPCLLLDYDYLSTKKKLDEGDDWTDFINPVTEFQTNAVADANVASLPEGAIIQFERKGYYRVDKPAGAESRLESGEEAFKRVELIAIPDGRLPSVALKAVSPPPVEATARAALPSRSMYESSAHSVDAVTYGASPMYTLSQARRCARRYDR